LAESYKYFFGAKKHGNLRNENCNQDKPAPIDVDAAEAEISVAKGLRCECLLGAVNSDTDWEADNVDYHAPEPKSCKFRRVIQLPNEDCVYDNNQHKEDVGQDGRDGQLKDLL